jgi:hypothetical protein
MSPEAQTDLDIDLSDLVPARDAGDLDWNDDEITKPYSVPALLAAIEERAT